jgi:predicted alternative tryptophan synthase beta-subunit
VKLSTETGALPVEARCLACRIFGCNALIYGQGELRTKTIQKDFDADMGSRGTLSPSNLTNSGRKILAKILTLPALSV